MNLGKEKSRWVIFVACIVVDCQSSFAVNLLNIFKPLKYFTVGTDKLLFCPSMIMKRGPLFWFVLINSERHLISQFVLTGRLCYEPEGGYNRFYAVITSFSCHIPLRAF